MSAPPLPSPLRLAACALLAAALAGPAHARRLVVVSSAETEPYRLAANGLARLGTGVETFYLSPDQEKAIAAALARSGRDTAIVALGGAAATLVAAAKVPSPSPPIVNCMVLGAAPPRAGAPIHVSLDIPIEAQGTWIRRLLPEARTIGILYDPAQNDGRAAESAAALKRIGFGVVLEPVPTPTALPGALQRLQNHVDLLHALPDTMVYAREHSRSLLLFSFRQRIPIAGPTEPWVKAGALFAVDWDYQDLGRYCGALALRQLAGGRTPAPPPPRTRVVANTRSAEQLRIRWDDETMRLIDKVYD